jgi:xanthine dehydrogenase small subunit
VASVRFVLDGQVLTADDVPPTLTVLEYLRSDLRRTGTKEGCAEGDCGACTVVLGTPSGDGRRVDYRAVNSCIRFLATIDGQELVTVESLQAPDGALHPVQQAMVDQHASQCGFCTPGFVMSLFALYLRNAAPDRDEVLETLSGNLCRCTGYRPIIDAGLRMGAYPAPAHWSRDAPQSRERLAALDSVTRKEALRVPGFLAPRTLAALAEALKQEPGSLILAGGTDVGLLVTKQLRELPAIVYIGEVAELKHIQRESGRLVIGAAVSLSDAWRAIVEELPALAEAAQRFGSPPVRNSGTLCGNLANGSPIGDAAPILMALGAELELRCAASTRRIPLERFYLGYMRKDLAPGEFVVSVNIPLPSAHHRIASYKLSKRIDQDISAVCAAFVVGVEGGRVSSARIAFGGLAAVVARAPAMEAALAGAPWNTATIEAAAACIARDFEPLTDFRAGAEYRLESAANLLRRFYLEHGAASEPLRTAAVAAAM